MIEHREFFPLTHSQRRIWYIEELYPNTCVHNIGGLVHIQGLVDMGFLEQAIHAFLCKNAAILFQLSLMDGEIKQFLSSERPAPLRFFDFCSEREPEQACNAWVQQEFTTPFTLLEHPLYDFALVCIDAKTSGYFVKLHHIVADGWTIQLMTEQISALYEQLASGQILEFQSEHDYIAYIGAEQHYLQSERFRKDQHFWREAFTEFPETFLAQSSGDLAASRKIFMLDAERTNALRQLAQQKKWSLNTLFVSALLLYFHKLQQQDEMIIGIPVFNRRGAKEKKLAGMFTSHMPFRMRLSQHQTLEAFQETVNQNLLRCFFHQKYPYDLLLQDLGVGRERINRLFQVCVNYYNTKLPNALAGYPLENREWFSGLQIYALQLVIKDWLEQGTLQIMIDYKNQDYTAEQIERLFAWLLSFIDITLEKHQTPLDEIGLLLKGEKQTIIYARNQTDVAYPRDQPVQSLFEEQVRRTPFNLALLCQDQRMTYEELNARSNQLARALRRAGVRQNDMVGILAKHSIPLVVGIWGILKAGGAYLPLDPTYPVERINYALADSQATLLLTDQGPHPDMHFAGEIIDLSERALYQGDASNVSVINQADDLAYLIYTSGSTGKPKGIMIEHRSLVNYLWWAKKTYVRDEHDCFALYSSIAFDLTVTSIFTPLLGGNSIVIYPENPSEFLLKRILCENRCTVIKATPAHLALIEEQPIEGSRLRCLIVGGEDLRTKIAQQVWHTFGGTVRIFNEYGPTEATVGCMIHEYLPERDTGISVPIGQPIDNTHLYLLTEQLQPVPDGIVAEIYIAGAGVARGYQNRTDLTAEKFLTNPFLPDERMYKTGDLGRYCHGTVEYLGRVDHQVKIQGYRIELAEIESELLKHEVVTQAVVCIRNVPNGQKYLVAFVQCYTSLPAIEIKRFLAQRLPAFMIPTLIIEQQSFPLSPNGKIDRDALALLALDDAVHDGIQADGVIVRQLIEVVREILQEEDVTAQSNLYFLGVDSIKAIQLASRLRTLGYQAKPTDILTYPVLHELALVLESSMPRAIYSQEPCAGLVKSTPMSEWLKVQALPVPDYWHQSIVLEMRRPYPAELLHQALRTLVRHHDALRCNYDQKAQSFFYNAAYLVEDLQVLASIDNVTGDAEAFQQICSNFKSLLHLSHGLLFRALLIHTVGKNDRLLLVAHHTIVDGVSWRILIDDLQMLLLAGSCGNSALLPAKTASLQAWTEALWDSAHQIHPQELAFWQQIGAKRTRFPSDWDADVGTISQRGTCLIELSAHETRRLLTEANQAYRTQAHDLLLTALVLVCADMLQCTEIILELEAHGREALFEHLDISRTVGWFTALYPLRLCVEGTDIASNIVAIKEQMRQIPQRGINFGILTYLAQKIAQPDRAGICWNYLGEIDNGQNGEVFTLSLENTGPDSASTNHLTSDLDIVAMIHAQKLRVTFSYSQTSYREATIQRIADRFSTQLHAIIAACCQAGQQKIPLETTAFLTEQELHLLLED